MSLPDLDSDGETDHVDALPKVASAKPGAGRLSWILGGMSVAVAIALLAVAIFVDQPRHTAAPAAAEARSALASAGDTGPVSVITADPTCVTWAPIGAGLVDVQTGVNWFDRDGSVSVAEWTPELRAMYATVSRAMGSVAVQTARLVPATPHRVMREAYRQVVTHIQAFVNRIPEYQATDIFLARTVDGLIRAVSSICGAATSGAAAVRAPLTAGAPPPTQPVVTDVDVMALGADTTGVCVEWVPMSADLRQATSEWSATDLQLPATEWPAAQQYAADAVAPVLTQYADESDRLGRRSGNAVVEDFAVLSAQYLRAFVQALPTYAPDDRHLLDAATNLTRVVEHSCGAVG